jgi:hypothetical protein
VSSYTQRNPLSGKQMKLCNGKFGKRMLHCKTRKDLIKLDATQNYRTVIGLMSQTAHSGIH